MIFGIEKFGKYDLLERVGFTFAEAFIGAIQLTIELILFSCFLAGASALVVKN